MRRRKILPASVRRRLGRMSLASLLQVMTGHRAVFREFIADVRAETRSGGVREGMLSDALGQMTRFEASSLELEARFNELAKRLIEVDAGHETPPGNRPSGLLGRRTRGGWPGSGVRAEAGLSGSGNASCPTVDSKRPPKL